MIRHVVILKLKENSPLSLIQEKILNLKEEIKEIINIEVGIDIGFERNSGNLCIITELKNIEDLEIYSKHPKHIEVIENYIKPNLISRNVVDYEKK